MSRIKLEKRDVRTAASWPAPIDVVFYKDKDGKLYRLRFIHDYKIRDVLEGLHLVMCLGNYAPDVIEGEITLNYENEIRVRDKDNKVYEIQKNAEKFGLR